MLKLLAASFLVSISGLVAAATLPDQMPQRTLGVGSCASSLCHGAVETWTKSRVLQNEYVTWSRMDKHARAYTVLHNKLSQQIATNLKLAKPAHEAPECLGCHTHYVPEKLRGERYRISDGVSCEACHGPAERYVRSHVERGASRKDNIARGLYPTADPVARAQLCLSCHFGNEQKFVTHKIMAAGHPRMSFELDTFTQIQPPHYRSDARQVWDGVRTWAIGQALAAHEILDILNHPKRGRDGLFPELVLFDCHSCHHPMRDRREAGNRLGVGPGVMRLNDSSLLMLRQIVRIASPQSAEAFSQQVTRFHRSVAGGDDALAQARALQKMIAQLIPAIGAYPFGPEDLRTILVGLVDDGLAGQYSDYHGAEQAVMGVQSVADFMQKRGLIRSASIAQSMKRLLTAVAHDEKYRAATFQDALRDLKSSIAPVAQ